MDPDLEEQSNDTATEQSVDDDQHDLVDTANEVLPKVQEERAELTEALNENDSESPQPTEEAPEEEASVEEQREAQAEGVPISEEEITLNEKIAQMRKTNFAQAVAKGSQLRDVAERSGSKRVFNATTGGFSNYSGVIGTGAALGLAGKSGYDIYKTATSDPKTDAPSNKASSDADIGFSWATSVLLSALSIIKVYNIMKSNDSTSAKILKAIPNLLGILCNIAESCIISAAKNTQKTKNVINFLAPAKTFLRILDCIGDHTGIMQRKKKLETMLNNGTSDKIKMKPVIDKLSKSAIEFIPAILSLGAKTVAELGYAIAYAKDPTSTTTFRFKIASQAATGVQNLVSAHNNHGVKNLMGADQAHKDLSTNLYSDFTSLYTDADLYLGCDGENATPDTFDKKQAALQAYENSQNELEVAGVSFYSLSHAEDRQGQQKIISSAVGY